RNGQEFNASEIGIEVGVDQKTIQAWVGVLQSSYLIYFLKPFHRNFNKTITKRPKLYFYDAGLVCYLLGITRTEQLINHPLRGAIFESFIVSELVKERLNRGLPINLYYWREKNKYEIDVLIENFDAIIALEIKSGQTIQSDYFKNIQYWLKLTKQKKGFVLYQGEQSQVRDNDKPYISLENSDTRRFAQEDPRSFLAQFSKGAIFDEAQRVPE
ncbi:unnamed protein product, partial [Darwinula stevensoni]